MCRRVILSEKIVAQGLKEEDLPSSETGSLVRVNDALREFRERALLDNNSFMKPVLETGKRDMEHYLHDRICILERQRGPLSEHDAPLLLVCSRGVFRVTATNTCTVDDLLREMRESNLLEGYGDTDEHIRLRLGPWNHVNAKNYLGTLLPAEAEQGASCIFLHGELSYKSTNDAANFVPELVEKVVVTAQRSLRRASITVARALNLPEGAGTEDDNKDGKDDEDEDAKAKKSSGSDDAATQSNDKAIDKAKGGE